MGGIVCKVCNKACNKTGSHSLQGSQNIWDNPWKEDRRMLGMVEQRRMGYQLEAEEQEREEDSKRVEVQPERGEVMMALELEQEEGELVLVMELEVVVKVVVEELEEVGTVVVAVLEVVEMVVEVEPEVVVKVVVE